MAGVKGRSGGARPGAGRKPRPPVLIEAQSASGDGAKRDEKPIEARLPWDKKDPVHFLEAVMVNQTLDAKLRIDAAKALLPYKHHKLGEGGKKEQRNEAAKKVAGRFSPAPPPKLVATGGKKV